MRSESCRLRFLAFVTMLLIALPPQTMAAFLKEATADAVAEIVASIPNQPLTGDWSTVFDNALGHRLDSLSHAELVRLEEALGEGGGGG